MTLRFQITTTSLEGLNVIQRSPHKDERGVFDRLLCVEELQTCLGERKIIQVNQSETHGIGNIRGLHFQYPPHAETKIITCLEGSVFDVAVDIRAGSKTFLHWYGINLSQENPTSLMIPEGFAHGFQVLQSPAKLLYFMTASYTPAFQGAIHVQEPRVGIKWPEQIHMMSARDAAIPMLEASFKGISCL